MTGAAKGYYRYWGKAGPTPAGRGCHLLPYHCLDVAATGEALLGAQPEFTRGVADFLRVEFDRLRSWLTVLLAIHDVGKFADGFQNLRPDLLHQLQGRGTTVPYDERHDTLGFRFLTARNSEAGAIALVAGSRWQALDQEDLRELLTPWFAAAAGHHGRPPVLQAFARPLSHQFPAAVSKDALAFLYEVLKLFRVEGAPFDLGNYGMLEAFRRVSWLTAGLAVAADWVGSNDAWFPYCDAPMPLEEYWHDHALPQARAAVTASGLLAAAPSAWSGVRGLFPKIEALTPLQRLAEEMELSAYPQLVVIEEVTGGGKTEAALALAHRLMEKRVSDGLYVGLPTMATANAMHSRVSEMYRRLFAAGSCPSLVLAHSASRMALALEERAGRGGGTREDTASRQCSDWLADSRKKALLAHVGVGTVDQALLAVLAARHQSMRLFGLSRKVLIVDEVHACDEYVHRLLCALLGFHSALGGSAILLSATLPTQMRAELVQAFGLSLGVEGSEIRSQDYPLVTHLTTDGLWERSVAARESACRRVAAQPMLSGDEVTSVLCRALAAGGSACWVRNTVDDALEAYGDWATRLGQDQVTLFHARFALVDRLRIESEVLRRFGPDSTAADRKGRLLIATQVVEQSLDLDFDAMVSDLAPIDLLIQRAGRLRRHARDTHGNRVDGPDRRGQPELSVFLPEPTLDPDDLWFASAFPRAAWVYPHHGKLWLTARWLWERRGFSMPEDAREMIEAVYGEDAQDEIPAGLCDRSQRAEGEGRAVAAQGRLNALHLEAGYAATTTHWQDDAYAPTRLGEPTVTVRLARWDDGRLIPWAEGEQRHAWQLSQVTIRRSRIAGEAAGLSAAALEAARHSMADQGMYCVVLPLESDKGRWVGSAVSGRGATVGVSYDGRFGLQYLEGTDP